MKITAQEEKRAAKLLQNLHVEPGLIESFDFMARPSQPRNYPFPKRYGPGILTLRLKNQQEKVVLLPPRLHPSSVIRYLVSQSVPFANYAPQSPAGGAIAAETFKRSSLYMFYFFALFLAFLILGYYFIGAGQGWMLLPAVGSFGLSLLLISTLITRFCYLSIDSDSLTLHSVGRSISYPYKDLRKVNFDFAREQTFTHVMELLDKEYRYRLFYIGRVPRTQLNEIATRLQQAGIDATCSLHENKRFYDDTHFKH